MVILLPGPREPSNVDPYLEPLLQDLVKYGPKGEQPSALLQSHLKQFREAEEG